MPCPDMIAQGHVRLLCILVMCTGCQQHHSNIHSNKPEAQHTVRVLRHGDQGPAQQHVEHDRSRDHPGDA